MPIRFSSRIRSRTWFPGSTTSSFVSDISDNILRLIDNAWHFLVSGWGDPDALIKPGWSWIAVPLLSGTTPSHRIVVFLPQFADLPLLCRPRLHRNRQLHGANILRLAHRQDLRQQMACWRHRIHRSSSGKFTRPLFLLLHLIHSAPASLQATGAGCISIFMGSLPPVAFSAPLRRFHCIVC